MQYNFEWDPAKARSNLRKHSVSFELASEVFRDSRQHYLVVVHTYRQQQAEDTVVIRLVSARPATRHEITQYQNG
ncbi:BrnT family toxin [Microbulbifer sp.]|uniref:BrnT family toxin n=1 Tax=Microbulbifer sp. TaxID=1908541 RepID=UPI003F2E46C6